MTKSLDGVEITRPGDDPDLPPPRWGYYQVVPEKVINERDLDVLKVVVTDENLYGLDLGLTAAGFKPVPGTYRAMLQDMLKGRDPQDPHFRDPLKASYFDQIKQEWVRYEQPRYKIAIEVETTERDDLAGKMINAVLEAYPDTEVSPVQQRTKSILTLLAAAALPEHSDLEKENLWQTFVESMES